MEHGPPPNDWLPFRDEHSDGDDAHAVSPKWGDDHAINALWRETVNVRVQHANSQPLVGEGDRQVRCHRRLADPTFPGGHRDDACQVLRPVEEDLSFFVARELLAEGPTLVLIHRTHGNLNFFDSIQFPNFFFNITGDRRFQGAPRCGEQHLHDDEAIIDFNALNHPQFG